MIPRTAVYAWAALGVTVVALGGFWLMGRPGSDPFADCRRSAVMGGAASVGGQFTLTDQTGARRTDADVITGPTLVYFGFTYCPDICPTDLARNYDAAMTLTEAGLPTTPVFISVDPGRDTPERLAEFASFFGPELVALTGSPEEIRAAANAYKTVYRIPDDTSGGNYSVSHWTQTYLMLPGAGFAEFFDREATADEIVRSVTCFADRLSA